MNESGIKVLPESGLVSLRDLAKFLGIRLDRMQAKLKKAGIKTTDLSRNSRFRFVNMADLIKSNLMLAPYKKKTGFIKIAPKSPAIPLETKKEQMTLQEAKGRIVFESGNPAEDRRLKEELMNPNDCFGMRYGKDECCQNCTVLAQFNGRKDQLKVFCQAMSPQSVEIKAA